MSVHRLILFLACSLLFFGRMDHGTSVVHLESLAYPDFARAAQIQGQVEVNAIVSSSGAVESALAVSGHPVLRAAAEQNIMRWKFNSDPESQRTVKVDYVFVLEEPKTYYKPETKTAYDLPTRVWVRSSLPSSQPDH